MQTREQHSTDDDQPGGAPVAGTTPETGGRERAPRRLERSRRDRMVAGVCGGLAEYFAIDPVIVRVATVALVVAGGLGLVPYIAAWLLMPAEGRPAAILAPTARPAHP